MQTSHTVYLQMLRLARRNVFRNWRHSLATILAIAAGFAAVSLFDGFIKEVEWQNEDGYTRRGMLGDVIVQRKDAQDKLDEDFWGYSLTANEQKIIDDMITKDPAFVRRVRFLNISGIVNTGKTNSIFLGLGYDPVEGAQMRGKRWSWNTVAGKPLQLAPPASVTVGGGLGRLLDCESTFKGKFIKPEGGYVAEERPFACRRGRLTLSATTENAQVNAIDLDLAGIVDAGYREADNRMLYVPLEQAQRLLDTDKITLMSIELKDAKEVPGFVERLRKHAISHGLSIDVMPWRQHRLAEIVLSISTILGVFRNLFMVIVVTIGVMSVANTMMKSVNERIREIGTLRSLGFLQRHIIFMFSAEGFFISLVACALGLGLTITVSEIVGVAGISYKAGLLSMPIGLKIQAAPVAWISSTVTLTLLASGTAWFCARRAAKMVVADAMRHV